jgi:hypothetical protein
MRGPDFRKQCEPAVLKGTLAERILEFAAAGERDRKRLEMACGHHA